MGLRRNRASDVFKGWVINPITSVLALALSIARGSQASEGNDGANPSSGASSETAMKWTVGKVFLSVFLFVVAALLEVGGGWLAPLVY